MRKIFTIVSLLFFATNLWALDPSDSVRRHGDEDSVFVFAPVTPYLDEAPDVLSEGLIDVAQNDSIQRYIDFVRSMTNKVRELNNYIKGLDEASRFELPVGIEKKIGNVSYELTIHAIRLKPGYAELDVVMLIETPQGQSLSFMANAIKFSSKGGIIGDAKLQLLGDYAINLNGNKSQIILKGTASKGETYTVIDCDGFRQLALDAEVKFSRDLIRPENPDGSVAEGNIVAPFKTVLTSWNDLVVQLSLPKFQITGVTGVGFDVKDAVLDFSDLRNAPAVQFPAGYGSSAMQLDPTLWRGFYMRELTVMLPPEFKQKGESSRVTFQAANVIIDSQGFTGTLRTPRVLSLEQGDMNGWAFSVENISIAIEANQITEAGFNGKIVIPVSDKDTPFDYTALIQSGGNYLFSVSPASDVKFNVWRAKVEIYESSFIEIRIVGKRFLPKAVLNGKMSVNASLSEGGQGVSLANIDFETLALQSVKPYIKVGNFSFGSEALQQKMAGFPISIQNIAARSISETKTGLDFTLKLNLVGEESGSFAADAGLTLVGAMENDGGWQRWKYKDIEVREIGVDVDAGAFKMQGRLIFYRNDQVYGDGFNGTIKAQIEPGLKLQASAIFGNVNGMRYWYADGMVNFQTGIPIFTGVGIYGFGGGLYYRMKMDLSDNPSPLGKTNSGTVYVPDERSGLGLKAVVALGSHPKPEAFNAEVTFEILFFKGGGVRTISFGGNGYLVTPGLDVNLDKLKTANNKLVGQVKKLEGQLKDGTKGLVTGDGSENTFKDIFGEIGEKAGSKGQISARVFIQYDFENRVLHGNFEAYINIAGGLVQGVGPGGRAGRAVLHFAPHEWYVYVGTPEDRIGISLGVGPIRASATSYFMVGTKILGSPPPPDKVAKILGMEPEELDYMRDLNALGEGAGFAFGAALEISTGNLRMAMFYARFDAGAGFDVMLKDYGDAHCEGRSGRLGINGWYANGQAYAYFEGKIGVSVRIFGRTRKAEILRIGAAVLLQAKLPNPFWMRGIVGGYFRAFGGLVRGNCRFKVVLGEDCKIVREVESPVADIRVISEITPGDQEADVDVFNNPQVIFNLPVDEEFELTDDQDRTHYFRAKFDGIKATSDGKDIAGSLVWNDAKDVVALHPFETLPSEKQVKLVAKLHFEENRAGTWTVVKDEGTVITEIREAMFTTGKAPNFIPKENVEYSYPVIGQLNYYKGETSEGYIKLRKGQSYLFETTNEWKQRGRFTTSTGEKTDFGIVYENMTVKFNVPTSSLKNNQPYALEIINVPVQNNTAIDRNVKTVTTAVQNQDETTEVEMVSRDAEGSIETLEETPLFTAYIRTSLYNTISEKVDAIKIKNTFRVIAVPWDVHQLRSYLSGVELFDNVDINGNGYSKGQPILQLVANLDDNTYYNKLVQPLVYDGYPIDGAFYLSHRTEQSFGLPPVKSMYIYQDPDNYSLRDEDYFNNTIPVQNPSLSYYCFDVPYIMQKDFIDFQKQAVNKYIHHPVLPPRVEKLILDPYPVLTTGTYTYKLQHVLPGTGKITSVKEFNVQYK